MDEFSDFQMAVQVPISSAGNKGPRYSDSSPVHAKQGHGHPTTKSDLFLRSSQRLSLAASPRPTLLKPVVPPPGPKNAFGKNVGSRLANYDLGHSVPGSVPPVQMNGNGFQSHASNGTTGLSPGLLSNPPKTISNRNQDLLIGDEDKYSALRMFMEADVTSSGSIFDSGGVESSTGMSTSSSSFGNLQPSSYLATNSHAIPTTTPPLLSSQMVPSSSENANHQQFQRPYPNSNCVSAFEGFPQPQPAVSKTMVVEDSFSDFGDFQSFSGFTSPPTTTMVGTNPSTAKIPSLPLSFATNVPLQTFSAPVIPPPISNFLPPPPPTTTAPLAVENGGCDSDGEFGDFVSVEPVVTSMPTTTTSSSINHCASTLLDDLSPTKINDSFSIMGSTQLPPLLPRPEETKQTTSKSNDGGLLGIETFFNPIPPESHQQSEVPQTPPFSRHFQLADQSQASSDKDDLDPFSDFTGALNTSRKNSSSSTSGLGQLQPSTSITPPTFIRTSLIRNDEVTDIDPLKWNQSVEEGNNDPVLDFIPFERKGSGGKSRFLDISPETRSIASLDLGNYVTVDYSEATNNLNNNNNNNNNNNSKGFIDQSAPLPSQSHRASGKLGPSVTPPVPLLHHQGILPSDEAIIYDEFDKYQCFREECENEKERYFTEWTRCLHSCKLIISKALSVFNSVSTSEVIKEVVADEKGYSYVMNILEVYRIFQRIQKSAERIGLEHRLRGSCEEITNLWETLTAFLLGTCVSTEICQEQPTSSFMDYPDHPMSQEDSASSSCGVCLCLVDTSLITQCLDYGGKIYHCNCANFWVNEVDSILPSLSSFPTPSSTENVSGMSSSNSNNGNGPNCSIDYLHHEDHHHSSALSKYDKTNSNSLV